MNQESMAIEVESGSTSGLMSSSESSSLQESTSEPEDSTVLPPGEHHEVKISDGLRIQDEVIVDPEAFDWSKACGVLMDFEDWPYKKHCTDNAEFRLRIQPAGRVYDVLEGASQFCDWHKKGLLMAFPELGDKIVSLD